MAAQVVACPGCQSTLKAQDHMAGKKAKCKRCGASFRIPGGEVPTGETVGDGQMLSAMDLPAPPGGVSPFDFLAPEPAAELIQKPAATLPKPASNAMPAPLPAKPVVAPPPPKVEVSPPLSLDDDAPPSDPLSFDGDDEVPTVVPAGEAFSFDAGSAAAAKSKTKSKARLLYQDDDEPRPALHGMRAYGSKGAGSSGVGKIILIVVVFGLVVGAVVGGVLIYLNGKKASEPASTEKKDDKKTDPPVEATPPPTPSGKGDYKGTDVPVTKGSEKSPLKKDPPIGKKPPSGSSGAMLALPPGRTIAFEALKPKFENTLEPSNRLAIIPILPGQLDASFTMARKVFPPHKRDIDIGVLWQTAQGFGDRGEKLVLGVYSPQTGRQQNQVAFDGDGSPEPACDLSADANLFAHAHTLDGKIDVWNTRTGTKVIDGFGPFADKNLKLAAVYITEPPEAFIAVSATGMVRAYTIPGKEQIAGEFIPAKTSSKPLAAGKSITSGPGRHSVVLAVGGAIYQVNVKPMVRGGVVAEIGGDVGRSFGLAAAGSQKLLYAFETDSANKKEKAVMLMRDDGNHAFYRWPDKDAGEPTVAGWVDDDLAMVGTDRGACVWFDAEGKNFKAIGLARTPRDKARHVAFDGHWTLLPDPADPKKCVLVEYAKPQSLIVGVLENAKQIPTVLLSDKGLQK